MLQGKTLDGSPSREHAPIVIKESGISLVIAKVFALHFLQKCNKYRPCNYRMSGMR